MSQNEDFLKAYKSLETAIRTSGYESVLAYENELDEKEKKTGKHNPDLSKLRLCRQCRNFVAHEEGVFFEANKTMISFLNDYAGKMSASELPIKKFVCKQMITEDTKVQDALAILLKRKVSKQVPVVDKAYNIAGFISYELVCAYLSKNNVNSTTKVKVLMGTKGVGSMFSTVKEDTHMSSIDDSKSYFVKNAKDQVIGWY